MRIRAMLACALAAAALPVPAAQAHEGNPNFRSVVNGVLPSAPGVEVEVLNFDDSLRLTNSGTETVTIEGYEGEPYARISPDGTVEINRRSPAAFLNEDRFADAPVPGSADPEAEPEWEVVDQTGQFSWHDHRAHYMAQGTPPQVTDESIETKVFDYEVPLDVGGSAAAIDGTLTWVGQEGGFPIVPFIALGAVVLLTVGVVVVVRRRRGRDDAGEAKEAW